jgi:hypothetical protein
MKDYMMWLDDNGVATWDKVLGELIVPDEVDIYEESLLDRYKTDEVWHGVFVPGVETDEDDFIVDDDDDEDEVLEDDELGDIQLKIDTIGSLLDKVFSDDPVAKQFTALIDTDMLTRLWDISEDISRLNKEEDEHGWSADEYWFNADGGLTGDAQNYLYQLDARGELI